MFLFIIIIFSVLVKWQMVEVLESSVAMLACLIVSLLISGLTLYRSYSQIARTNEVYYANEALSYVRMNLVQLLWLSALPTIGAVLYMNHHLMLWQLLDTGILSMVLIAITSWCILNVSSNAYKRLEGASALNNRSI